MSSRSRLAKIFVGYTLLICLWVLARFIFQDRFLPLSVINTFAEYLFIIPLPFFLLLSLFRPTKWTRVLLIPIGVFFVFWGAQYLPNFPPVQAADTPQIRVMTFNVRSANEDPDLLIQSINQESPDLLGFQEISANNLPALQQGLAKDFPYDTFDLYDGRVSDIGFASRYPILSYKRLSFPPRDGAVHALVDWNGVQIHVFVLHFSADNLLEHSLREYPSLERKNLAYRALEVTRLEEEIEGLTGPIIVLCDCNFSDTTETYGRMSAWLLDSFKQTGWGPGHTLAPFEFVPPILRIDYVWHNTAFFTLSAELGDQQSSDHRPVIANLKLIQTPSK